MFQSFYKSCMKNFSSGSLKDITQIWEIEEKPTVKYIEGKWLREQLEQQSDLYSLTVKENKLN